MIFGTDTNIATAVWDIWKAEAMPEMMPPAHPAA
jgi:hypothetical protein